MERRRSEREFGICDLRFAICRWPHRASSPLLVLVLATILLAGLASPAVAVTHLKRQTEAPAFTLKDLNGAEVSSAKLRGSTIILIFGEVYHAKTREACTQIDAVLKDPRFAGLAMVPVLITVQEPKPEDLKPDAGVKLPAMILRDPGRVALGDYRVAVMPSVVVIDKDGRVVHAMAGLTSRFADTLTDALLLSAGKLSAERFEESLNPAPTTGESETALRAPAHRATGQATGQARAG